jgi:hypothetical protein
MDQATYDSIPETMQLRELRYQIVEEGRRTQELTIVKTLLDAKVYTKEDVAELYGFRWNVELDIRSIKQSLQLCHVRCKSPVMVRKELWLTLLGYNLISSGGGAIARQTATSDQFYRYLPICTCILEMLWAGTNRRESAHSLLSEYALSDCRMRGRQSPRSHRAARHQATMPALQADARTS